MSITAKNIRNIAIIGHSGEGKTSLAEAMLFNAKVIDRLGKTADGTTVMDYDEQEIARGISISTSWTCPVLRISTERRKRRCAPWTRRFSWRTLPARSA